MAESVKPLVSIIGLCYNQAPYIVEALNSIKALDYPNLEVILLDDASTDNSVEVLQNYATANPGWTFIYNEQNLGNCRTFNKGLQISRGEFIVDFALDDVLLPERISKQVNALESAGPAYGVCYTDAELINANSETIGFHYKQAQKDGKHWPPPSGNIFAELLKRYFISTPTMLIRRSVLLALNGYDEELAYEDFDFWVRSARVMHYLYLDEVLTKKRIHGTSMSKGFYKSGQLALFTATLTVCEKALKLVNSTEEKSALAARVCWEARMAGITGHTLLLDRYQKLLESLNQLRLIDKLLFKLLRLPLPWRKLYSFLKL